MWAGPSPADIQRLRLELDAIERARNGSAAEPEALLDRAFQALADARTMHIDDFAVVAVTRAASVLGDAGRASDARRLLEEHEPQLGRLRDHPLGVMFARQHIRALCVLARAAGDAQRPELWREVERRTTAVIEVVERFRTRVTVPDLQSAYTRFSIDIYTAAVEACLSLGDDAGALQRAELVKCRSAHRLRQAPPMTGTPLREEFRRISGQIDEAVASGARIPESLRARRRALWDLIAIERFTERAGTYSGFRLAELQARLPPELAVVWWFWLDRTRIVVAAIDTNDATVVVQPVTEAERSGIDDKAARILSFDPNRDSTSVMTLRSALADLLLPPKLRPIIEGKKRLVFSPHRSLHALPLHALPWEGRVPLIRRFAVSYAPNLTILQRPLPPRRTGGRVLFVGVPRRRDHQGAALDGAARENDYLLQHYGPERLVSRMPPDGTKAELEGWNERQELERFSALHFVCHGMNIDSDNPMDSRLLLYDSDLDGLEISQWRLDADLVVLSACSSGQRPISGRSLGELPGDELFGLQAAFFAAGARQVLATLWPTNDFIAPGICADFHAAWEQLPADVALQRAVCAYFDFDKSAALAEQTPYVWAAFFLTASGMPPPCPERQG